MNETSTQPRKDVRAARILVALVLLLIVVGVVRACSIDNDSQSAARTRSAAATRRAVTSDEFTVVRNDCGLCGTNSPVGGWESEDGRALILDADGSFIALFGDGTSMSGAWEQDSSELCLSPAVGGEVCNSYRQLVDAMKWGDAVYIRR